MRGLQSRTSHVIGYLQDILKDVKLQGPNPFSQVELSDRDARDVQHPRAAPSNRSLLRTSLDPDVDSSARPPEPRLMTGIPKEYREKTPDPDR